MKDGKLIFNMKNEDLAKNLSQKLLTSFDESKYYLEHQFICLKCLGISINALYCKNCKYSYCDSCIQFLPASKIICICRKTSKQNFEFQINNDLFNTYYCIQDKSSFQKNQISYPESLSWNNESPYIFIPSENGDPTTIALVDYNENCQHTNLLISRHQVSYLHPFSLKETRFINFHFAKGYPLELEDKILCTNDGNFLRAIHLKKIVLVRCQWNIDFSLSLNKAIRSSKNKLKEITMYNNREGINLKSYLIIFNALAFSLKLEKIVICPCYKFFKDKQIPKSFYKFLSRFFILTEITFIKFAFYDYMNFNPFQGLMSLQYLCLMDCKFNFNSFKNMYQNNFPKLQFLYLSRNKITNSFSGENICLTNPFLHKAIKFPSRLFLYLIDSSYSLENLLFEELIKSKSIKLKSLEIYFSDNWNSKPIPSFLKFLKVSNIQFLSFDNLEATQGFDSDEFCEFLKNSKFLQGLKLTGSKKDVFNTGLILQALSFNRSIKVLYLRHIHLSNFFSDLINLILSNQVITILNLRYSDIQVNVDFINALSKNKSVLYLNLSLSKINNDDAVKLSQLTLKGIKVYDTGFSVSNEEMINKKIPKFEAPYDILGCEEFLEKKKVN